MFNPLDHRGIPLDQQVRNWRELDVEPVDPLDADPYTRCRIIALNGVETEAILFSHHFARTCTDPEVRRQLAEVRYVEAQQQRVVNWLLPGVPSALETTIAYEQAGVGPEDLNLVELHDCFATAELVHYDNLMLCPEGGAVDFFESGAPFRDGNLPVNVSGGLESKGHPIAATGIANVWEIAHHLRGEAGDRQIEGAKVGLAHVIGLGSACGVHILEKSGL